MDESLLSPLLQGTNSAPKTFAAALAADPALAGRVRCDPSGIVVLSGPSGGPPPASRKEREIWELRVRLRAVAELGAPEAERLMIEWRVADA
jgi:hypothetical protein